MAEDRRLARAAGSVTTGYLVGEDAAVRCYRYPDTTPILIVEATSSASFSVSGGGRGEVTDADMRFARELVAGAQSYLVECERLRAAAVPARRATPRHVDPEHTGAAGSPAVAAGSAAAAAGAA